MQQTIDKRKDCYILLTICGFMARIHARTHTCTRTRCSAISHGQRSQRTAAQPESYATNCRRLHRRQLGYHRRSARKCSAPDDDVVTRVRRIIKRLTMTLISAQVSHTHKYMYNKDVCIYVYWEVTKNVNRFVNYCLGLWYFINDISSWHYTSIIIVFCIL